MTPDPQAATEAIRAIPNIPLDADGPVFANPGKPTPLPWR